VFDLLFSPVEHAFGQAEGFFSLLAEKLQGKRVVFLAGNHDHHIIVRYLRAAVELKVATGTMAQALSDVYFEQHRSFFQRFLDRRLEGIDSRIVYPTHRVGDVLLSHGHYLDAHVRDSLANRALRRSAWRIAGGQPEDALMVEDYEAVIVPLTELLFTVAQMPSGTAAQQAFYAQFQRVGRLLQLPSSLRRDLERAGRGLADVASVLGRRLRRDLVRGREDGYSGITIRDGNGRLPDDRDIRAACQMESPAGVHGRPMRRQWPELPAVRACDPAAPVAIGVEAYGLVIRNLGWGQAAPQMVFAHTHQPLDGVCDSSETIRFWNTGSWIYDPPRQSSDAYRRYLERAWPGTGVLIDTERESPELIEMLAEYNPLTPGRRQPRRRVTTPGDVLVRPFRKREVGDRGQALV
jgi:hypothetical protein